MPTSTDTCPGCFEARIHLHREVRENLSFWEEDRKTLGKRGKTDGRPLHRRSSQFFRPAVLTAADTAALGFWILAGLRENCCIC